MSSWVEDEVENVEVLLSVCRSSIRDRSVAVPVSAGGWAELERLLRAEVLLDARLESLNDDWTAEMILAERAGG